VKKQIAVAAWLLCALLLQGVSCAKEPEFSAKQKDDIREVVLRWLLPDTKQRYGESVYFLRVDDHDPSKGLLARFQGLGASVKPASASKRLKKLMQVVDRKTNEKGAILFVDQIKRISDTKAVMEGGYIGNGRAAAFYDFAVELKKGKWLVTKHKCTAVS